MRRRSVFRDAPLRAEHDASEAILYDVQISGPTALGMMHLLLADGGYAPALDALTRPCPAMPAYAFPPEALRLAEAMGVDVATVDRELFLAASRAWKREKLVPWAKIVEAYGIGSAFADAAVGREWPVKEAAA